MFSRINIIFLICMMITFGTVLQTHAYYNIYDLIIDVKIMNLEQGLENSLVAKLERAEEALERDQQAVAINKLNSFINEVEAQRDKKLTERQADCLVSCANIVIRCLS